MKVIRRYRFHAAHRIFGFGDKCARLHGHTYYVNVALNVDENNLISFEDIDKKALVIVQKYCHHLILKDTDSLCNVLESAGEPFLKVSFDPTSEMLSKEIFNNLRDAGLNVAYVELSETPSSAVIYAGDS